MHVVYLPLVSHMRPYACVRVCHLQVAEQYARVVYVYVEQVSVNLLLWQDETERMTHYLPQPVASQEALRTLYLCYASSALLCVWLAEHLIREAHAHEGGY